MKWIDSLLMNGVLIIILSLSSCSSNNEHQFDQNAFNLESLVNAQVFFLSDNNYGILKTSRLGSKEEQVEHYLDSSGWANELNILKTADISKPGLRPYYTFQSSESSRHLIDSYIIMDTGKYSTVYQKIYRDKKSNHLAKIIVEQRVDNPIYHSGRNIEIVFKGFDKNAVIIDSIKVEGFQKIIFMDTAHYTSISRVVR